ncbi:MAG TPA: hypothetical protein VII95_01135 [Terriglobales bacterium]|jgi:hypothetical protein
MSTSQATHQDAELILKLYDLRREPVMREARNFVFGFAPKSVDEIVALTNAFGTKENAYLRQVYGYWEMAAALVVHGTLNALLVYDTCHEMYFVYGKIQPFLEEFRRKSGMPDFLSNLQRVVEGSEEGRERLARMQKRQAEMAAAAAR